MVEIYLPHKLNQLACRTQDIKEDEMREQRTTNTEKFPSNWPSSSDERMWSEQILSSEFVCLCVQMTKEREREREREREVSLGTYIRVRKVISNANSRNS